MVRICALTSVVDEILVLRPHFCLWWEQSHAKLLSGQVLTYALTQLDTQFHWNLITVTIDG